jgi:hypothetical protein
VVLMVSGALVVGALAFAVVYAIVSAATSDGES